jgi:hypothetical protein
MRMLRVVVAEEGTTSEKSRSDVTRAWPPINARIVQRDITCSCSGFRPKSRLLPGATYARTASNRVPTCLFGHATISTYSRVRNRLQFQTLPYFSCTSAITARQKFTHRLLHPSTPTGQKTADISQPDRQVLERNSLPSENLSSLDLFNSSTFRLRSKWAM